MKRISAVSLLLVLCLTLAGGAFGKGFRHMKRFPKPPRGTPGDNPFHAKSSLSSFSGSYTGALVIGGQVCGTLAMTLSDVIGVGTTAPVALEAFGLGTESGLAKIEESPAIRMRFSTGRGVGIAVPSMSLKETGKEPVTASFAAVGCFIPANILEGRHAAFVAVGELRFRGRGLAARFGGQDMGSYFGGQDMGSYLAGQPVGEFFGGQDMGSYFGGQDMGSYLRPGDVETYFTGTAPEFGGQDMGSYFGGQDMGSYLAPRDGGFYCGVLLRANKLPPSPFR